MLGSTPPHHSSQPGGTSCGRACRTRSGTCRYGWSCSRRASARPRGLVHHYFGSRRALFLAVLAELADRLPAAIRTDLEGLTIEETVKANSNALLDAVERDGEAWRALLGAAGPDREVQAILDGARDQAVERILVNQATGAAAAEELRLVLRVFLGAAVAGLAEWVLRDRATRPQTQVLLARTLLAMVAEVLPRVPPG